MFLKRASILLASVTVGMTVFTQDALAHSPLALCKEKALGLYSEMTERENPPAGIRSLPYPEMKFTCVMNGNGIEVTIVIKTENSYELPQFDATTLAARKMLAALIVHHSPQLTVDEVYEGIVASRTDLKEFPSITTTTSYKVDGFEGASAKYTVILH